MKQLLLCTAASILLSGLAFAGGNQEKRKEPQLPESAAIAAPREKASYHIAVLSPPADVAPGIELGIQTLIERYGSAEDEGLIVQAHFPEGYLNRSSVVRASVIALLEDPMLKAIVACGAPRGTAEAFREVRREKPDIVLLAGDPLEDSVIIESSADFVASQDYVAKAYAIVAAAKEMGADGVVYLSFERHLSYEPMAVSKQIMERAAAELTLPFHTENIADPAGKGGLEGAKRALATKLPLLVGEYGKNAAFFCTDDSLAPTLIKGLLESGGYYVEQETPSVFVGYLEALGLGRGTTDYATGLDTAQSALVERGASGRFGSWAVPWGYAMTAALITHVKNAIEEKSELTSLPSFMDVLTSIAPTANWRGQPYVETNTGVRARSDNHVTLALPIYVFGRGALASPELPQAYYDTRTKR